MSLEAEIEIIKTQIAKLEKELDELTRCLKERDNEKGKQ